MTIAVRAGAAALAGVGRAASCRRIVRAARSRRAAAIAFTGREAVHCRCKGIRALLPPVHPTSPRASTWFAGHYQMLAFSR
jgi:hypothetical protein